MPDADPTTTASTGRALWDDAPISRNGALILCGFLIAFFMFQIFWLFGFWPHVDAKTGDWVLRFHWFFFEAKGLELEPGQRILIIVLICGGIGAQVHTLASYAIHMAHRDFSRDWVWWYILRPFQGSVVAFAVYFMFESGLASTVTTAGNEAAQAATKLTDKMATLYRSAAIAVLVGMFSEQAVEKLRQIANTILATPVSKSGENAAETQIAISDVKPATLRVNAPEALTISGSGFVEKGLSVSVDGKARTVEFKSASEIRVVLDTEDVQSAGSKTVTIELERNGRKSSVVTTFAVVA